MKKGGGIGFLHFGWGKGNSRFLKKRVFLDHASTTPVDKDVLLAMKPFWRGDFANAGAIYKEGVFAKRAVDESRAIVATLLRARSQEIVFTGSGTEANNLALFGVAETFFKKGKKPHVITTVIEHPSVLEVCKEIEKRGGRVTYLEVGSEGIISLQALREALGTSSSDEAILVSVMHANNEIGVIEPIVLIAKALRRYKKDHPEAEVVFHTDASQSANYCELNVTRLGVDLLTLDASKIYGPKGVGLLYVKSGLTLSPLVYGGGQERGLRSGTESPALVVGMARAFERAVFLREKEAERLTKLRDYAIGCILSLFKEASLNGSKENRLPNNINICFPGSDAEFLVIKLDSLGIACSYSSSCRTLAENSSSYVIEALGKKECALSSLRFTLGRGTTKKDINYLLAVLKKIF